MTASPPLLVLAAGGRPRMRRVRVPVPKEIKLHVPVADLLRDHCLPDWKHTHSPSGEVRDARTASKPRPSPAPPRSPANARRQPCRFGAHRQTECRSAAETPTPTPGRRRRRPRARTILANGIIHAGHVDPNCAGSRPDNRAQYIRQIHGGPPASAKLTGRFGRVKQ
jgi:hypothetical protein